MRLTDPSPSKMFSREDVVRILKRDFPEENQDELLTALDEYGSETWQRERERVQLAVLKMAAGSAEELRTSLEAAKMDYRDVLAVAEYPEHFHKIGPASSPEEKSAATEADRRQYEDWMRRA